MSNLATTTIDAEILEDNSLAPLESIESDCCFSSDGEIVGDWLLGKSKHTQKCYFSIFNQLNKFLENKALKAITKQDLQRFLYHCQQKGNKPSSVNLKLSALRSLFKHLVAENYRTYSPATNIKLQKSNKADKAKQSQDVRQRVIPKDEIKSIIDNALNDRDAVLIELTYSLGLRMHEAVNLSWSDFYQANGKWYVSILGKGSKVRHNYVPDSLIEKLNGLGTNDYIFLSNRGKPLSLRACDKNFKIACKRAGLPKDYSFHWLRHSHASVALESGKSLVAVRDQLGHSSIAVTSQYLHSNESSSLELF